MRLKNTTKQVLLRCITIYAPVSCLFFGIAYLQRNYFYQLKVKSQPRSSVYIKAGPKLTETVAYGRPAHLSLPRIGIDLDVLPGAYSTSRQSWRLDDSHAFWMTDTPEVTSRSVMTVVYGHDEDGVFGNLSLLEPLETMVVTTAQGSLLTYRYTHDAIVAPNDTNILLDSKAAFTLLTCTGNLYEKRRVMYFDLVSAIPHRPAPKVVEK